jgi:hypothetical protein
MPEDALARPFFERQAQYGRRHGGLGLRPGRQPHQRDAERLHADRYLRRRQPPGEPGCRRYFYYDFAYMTQQDNATLQAIAQRHNVVMRPIR